MNDDLDELTGLAEYLAHLANGEATVFSLRLIGELSALGAVADPNATKLTDFHFVPEEKVVISGGSSGGDEDGDWRNS